MQQYSGQKRRCSSRLMEQTAKKSKADGGSGGRGGDGGGGGGGGDEKGGDHDSVPTPTPSMQEIAARNSYSGVSILETLLKESKQPIPKGPFTFIYTSHTDICDWDGDSCS